MTKKLDYSTAAEKIDKFMPDNYEVQGEFYQAKTAKELAAVFDEHARDSINRYLPKGGTTLGLAKHIIKDRKMNENQNTTIVENKSLVNYVAESFSKETNEAVKPASKFDSEKIADTSNSYAYKLSGSFGNIVVKSVVSGVDITGRDQTVVVVDTTVNGTLVSRLGGETLPFMTGDDDIDEANWSKGQELLKKEGKAIVDKVVKIYKKLDKDLQKL